MFSFCPILLWSLLVKKSAASSANMLMSPYLIHSGTVFTYIRNSKGPKTDPWGTPQVVGWSVDRVPLQITLCWWLVRYEENQSSSVPEIPKVESFFKGSRCLTVLNALARSKKQLQTLGRCPYLVATCLLQSTVQCELIASHGIRVDKGGVAHA